MGQNSRKKNKVGFVLSLTMYGSLVFLISCGTSGGMQVAPSRNAANGEKEGPEDAERQALIKEFDVAAILECREDGLFYDRRGEKCLSDLKTKGFTCARESIIKTFSETGSQINQILDRSLGDAAIPGDRGEGYVIDQCGKSASGRLLVSLIKKDPAGKLQVREIEAKRSPTKP